MGEGGENKQTNKNPYTTVKKSLILVSAQSLLITCCRTLSKHFPLWVLASSDWKTTSHPRTKSLTLIEKVCLETLPDPWTPGLSPRHMHRYTACDKCSLVVVSLLTPGQTAHAYIKEDRKGAVYVYLQCLPAPGACPFIVAIEILNIWGSLVGKMIERTGSSSQVLCLSYSV